MIPNINFETLSYNPFSHEPILNDDLKNVNPIKAMLPYLNAFTVDWEEIDKNFEDFS